MLLPLFLTIKQRRDRQRRLSVKNREIPTRIEKLLEQNYATHWYTMYYPYKNLNIARVKKTCLWNGRCRGINFKGFSRHAIKFLGTRGAWLGLRKASW